MIFKILEMINIRKVIVPFIVCTSLLSGCKNPFESKDKGVEKLNDIENRWDDAVDVASSTARIALPTPIANLQGIKRDLASIELSDCLKPAQKELSDYMGIKINVFLKFMADKESTEFESDDKLIKYFAIKKECAGDQVNTKSKLASEAKAKAEAMAAMEMAAKKKGISVAEEAASEATSAASEATAAASEAMAAAGL